jgi:predicted amidohydrolase YtcJ
MGPAILSGKQHVQGSITPGKWADLIMLDQDLFTIDADRIGETQVDATIFAGALVYQR